MAEDSAMFRVLHFSGVRVLVLILLSLGMLQALVCIRTSLLCGHHRCYGIAAGVRRMTQRAFRLAVLGDVAGAPSPSLDGSAGDDAGGGRSR